jgi:hypothetical protein
MMGTRQVLTERPIAADPHASNGLTPCALCKYRLGNPVRIAFVNAVAAY